MAYTENLIWILDKFDERGSMIHSDARYQENIDFVHSLKLKCDSVGWCRMSLDRPDTGDILNRIESFCRESGWKARGYYEREYTGSDCGWYELTGPEGNDDSIGNRDDLPSEDGGEAEVYQMYAFKNRSLLPKVHWEFSLVSEHFMRACRKHNLEGLTFCWAEDKGKYLGEQFFQLYADREIPEIGCSSHLSYGSILNHRKSEFPAPGQPYPDEETVSRFRSLGGWLPRLAEIFYKLDVSLPVCFRSADLPDGGFAQAHYSHVPGKPTYCSGGYSRLLIHKDTAKVLLDEKVISPASLRCAMVVDEIPDGYFIAQTQKKPRPTREVIHQRIQQYEALKASPRPVKQVSEKEAVKLLRAAVKERKEDFGKRPKKEVIESLTGTEYAPLAPYYATGHGFLSDEYELLSPEHSEAETLAFAALMEQEELISERICGIVFCKCPDGDRILLREDGSISRVSHEAPEEITHWKNAAEFFSDALLNR